MTRAGTLTCVITGATSGIGLEAARQLAGRGTRVIGIGRSAEECRVAAEVLRRSARRSDARFIPADLSSVERVRRTAALVRQALPSGRLDRLIHGTDTISSRYVGTEDGLELQFAVNYLAAFLLTRELFAALIRPAESRVIAVSSGSHRRTEIDWQDPMFRQRYSGVRAYRQSKLALVLFTLELNRRVGHRFPVRAIGVEPGPAAPARGGGRISVSDAATAIVRLAAEPASSIGSDYWRLGRPAEPSLYARRADAAGRLWSLSEKLCGADFL
jgi:NAD(P)-dependent dehydrogenase (short-subunit alcohol dehydrogenase family)